MVFISKELVSFKYKLCLYMIMGADFKTWIQAFILVFDAGLFFVLLYYFLGG